VARRRTSAPLGTNCGSVEGEEAAQETGEERREEVVQRGHGEAGDRRELGMTGGRGKG
jgi:hypothetical protein